ncbi:hypothetical protein EU520_00115 [Candidatus Thorarchaeota archaeon]|nr:MAG: hypothetical protein EU520_00115 [Candidatus Thorarchaeota archaeon]
MFLRFTVIPSLLELTPGFLFSELGGVVGGVFGGLLVGAIVGLSGAIGGGEFPLLPLIGNMALGLGTGIAIHIQSDRSSRSYAILAVVGGGLIGGFLPTLAVSLWLFYPIEAALLGAVVDGAQAVLWAVVAVVVERIAIRPVAGLYLYQNLHAQDQPLEDPSD